MKLSPNVFFETYAPVAVNDSVFTGIPPSIKLAQAALESGWAGSGLTINANNYFGIKSHNWGGATYDGNTHEFYGGSNSPTYIKAPFRLYGSPYESFMDHSKFLKENQRYDSLFTLDPLDYKGWAYGLQDAGYATSPTYGNKLVKIIEDHGLQKYDRKASNQKALKNFSLILLLLSAAFIAFLLIRKLIK